MKRRGELNKDFAVDEDVKDKKVLNRLIEEVELRLNEVKERQKNRNA